MLQKENCVAEVLKSTSRPHNQDLLRAEIPPVLSGLYPYYEYLEISTES